MDIQRLILLFIFGFSLILLWDAWEREHRPKPAPVVQKGVPHPSKPLPEQVAAPKAAPSGTVPGVAGAPAAKRDVVRVRTDVVEAEIDTTGATLSRLRLLKHKATEDLSKPLALLGPEHRYEAQSGLTGEAGPNHRSIWRLVSGEPQWRDGQDALEVRFAAEGGDGVVVEKTYTFRRDDYVIDVALEVRNGGAAPVSPAAYFQLTNDGRIPAGGDTLAQSFGAQSFLGFAEYTEEKKFQKIPASDLDKGKPDHLPQARDGWLAFVQHYFVSAWLPPEGAAREYVFERRSDGIYAGRAVLPVASLAPGERVRVQARLYAGPQEQRRLKTAAEGLDLVVDYGWLTIIAWPLFWVLEQMHKLSGNWGVAIILLTVLIKLIFFPLSAASYKSMAKMKLITPRLTKIREMYAHDRQKMNQAMMELYKTEKINPLGGCFPILVQIPVFIALYWVLLAAIELRHAPFILWIKDLSALDPYYVLPILMSLTMILQTRMNPKPPDPVQAKVMQVMPFVFSVFFFFFPAGLVLYWLVNNILSILQQWQIQRMFERAKPAHGKR